MRKSRSYSKIKLFKQAFWSAFKHKVQIILLILLTFILSTTITLSWISSKWIFDGVNFMGSKQTSIDYSYTFSSKSIINSQSIAPTLDICNFYLNIDVMENDKKITTSTPSLNISSSSNTSKGCLKKLKPENLKIHRNSDDLIEKIEFDNLLEWKQINIESEEFKSSLMGQLYKKSLQGEITEKEFHNLYDEYRILVEKYINNIFSFYLTNFYLTNEEEIKNNSNTFDVSRDSKFVEDFLKKYINPSEENESNNWLQKVTQEEYPDWKNNERIPILGGGVNIPNQITKEKYKEYFNEKENDFEKRSFFKQGFKGTLGNILINVDSKNNTIFETIQDYGNFNKDYHIKKRELILNISGQILGSNWNDHHKIWEYHNLIIGKLTNFNINVRKEYLFSDFSNNIRYRIIALNPMNKNTNNNFRVVKGSYPKGFHHIGLNEQYAKKHNYNIGDSLTIGNYKLTITALGADNFTILPIVNEVNFLPNPDKEGIIFVNPELYTQENNFILYSDVWDISRVYLQYYGKNMEKDIQKFQLFLNDNIKYNDKKIIENSQKMQNYYKNPLNINTITSDLQTKSKIEKNNDNNFINRGFNSIDSVFNGYVIFNIIVVLFMIFLVIFITVISVRKDIENNSIQIGILKALGYKNKTIIMSYWSYSLITSLIAVPLGWIIGSVMQLYIMEILNKFFTIPTNVFYLDFIPLIIALFINISSSIITISFTGYKFLKQNVKLLLHPDNQIQPSKIILQIYHKYFSFHNFKVRFSLILTAVSYKKIIFMLITIILSSLTISVSLMLPAAVKSLDNSYYGSLKYQSLAEFVSPTYNIPTSRLNLYHWNGVDAENKSLEYPIKELKPISDWYQEYDEKTKSNEWKELEKNAGKLTVDDISKQLAFNYYWTGGRGISLGWLRKISQTFNNNDRLSKLLSTIVCPLLNSILSNDNAEFNQNWETCILKAIQSAVPSYVKELLNKESRKNRFVIAYNSLAFNPDEDELFTYYDSEYNNNSFKSFGIKPESKMIVLNNNKKIIEENKIEINSDNTKTIPVIINSSMKTTFNLKINNVFNAKLKEQKELQYEGQDNKWYSVKPEFWIYENDENQKENLYNMPLDKWSLSDNQTVFGWTNTYNYKGNENPKEYYNLNKIILKLPKNNKITGQNAVKNEFLEKINNAKLPTNISKPIISSDSDWWYIRPFVPFGKNDKYIDENSINNPLNLLNQSTTYPLWNLFSSLIYGNTVKNEKVPQLLRIEKYEKEIKYRVKGIHNSYEEPKIFLNQETANDILNFNNTKSDDIYEKDPYNKEFLWFNGKYSSNPELTDITSQYNISSNSGDYSISSLSFNVTNAVSKPELLTIKKELIQNLIRIASSITSIFILGAICLSIIIVMMISNLLVHQFAKLMAIMKIEGYKNSEINNFTLIMFIPTTLLGFGIGFGLSWIISKTALWSLGWFTGIIIPLHFHWWILVVAFLIISFIYLITYIFSFETLKRIKVLELVGSED